MAKINLLFVITKLELGGAQTQALRVIASLDRSRYQPFLFTAAEGILLEKAAACPGLHIHRSSFLERPINPLRDLFAICELVWFIRRNRIHIVHTHSSKAGIIGRFAAWLAGCRRVVHTVHGWPFNDFQHVFIRQLYIGLERLAARLCLMIIVVSEHDRAKGLSLGIGVAGQYTLIAYGIDHHRFWQRQQRAAEDPGVRIGMISCFKPQKSLEDLVSAAARLSAEFPRSSFQIAGDGVMRSRIEELLKEKQLTGRFSLDGWIEDIPEFLSSLDIFVLTSLWEGMPISVLEAMASGLPVVVTDTGGVREIVADGDTGFIVQRRDVDSLADRLGLLCRDAALRRQMGERGRQRVNKGFSSAACVDAHAKLYEEVL